MKIKILLIIIAVLFVSLICSIYLNIKPITVPVSNPSPTPVPTTSQQVTFKKYTDKQGRYQINYPSTWYQVDDDDFTTDSQASTPLEMSYQNIWMSIKYGTTLVLDKNSVQLENQHQNQITKALVPDKNDPQLAPRYPTYIIKNGTQVATIQFLTFDRQIIDSDLDLFDQIVASFVFTNNNPVLDLFSSINSVTGINQKPTQVEKQYFFFKGEYSTKKVWQIDLSSISSDKSKFTQVMNILTKDYYMTIDNNGSGDGGGASVSAYKNSQMECTLESREGVTKLYCLEL